MMAMFRKLLLDITNTERAEKDAIIVQFSKTATDLFLWAEKLSNRPI